MAVCGLLRCYILLVCYVTSVRGSSLVLGGGSMSDDSPMWDQIVELAGGNWSARIGIITAASTEPEQSARRYVALFSQRGVTTEWLPIHPGNLTASADPAVISRINAMTGFLFGDGSQIRITESLIYSNGTATPALEAIRHVFNNGHVIAGEGAGAACTPMATMVVSGMSWDALRYGAQEYNASSPEVLLQYRGQGGIGVLNDFVPDVYTSEMGREGRLIRLLSDTQGSFFGLGLDEDTAFVIKFILTSNTLGQVMGKGGVFIPDISQAVVNRTSTYWNISRVYAHYLTDGDYLNIFFGQISFASWKTDLKGKEKYEKPLTSEEIFAGNRNSSEHTPEFVQIATRLFDSYGANETYGLTKRSNPRFRVTFDKSKAKGVAGASPATGTRIISYTNLEIAISQDIG